MLRTDPIDLALSELKTCAVVADVVDGVLPRQPGAGQGQGRQRLHRHQPDRAGAGGEQGLLRTPGPTASTINEGTLAYNYGKYEEAPKLYQAALTSPSGEQLRTLNGIHLANWKLGRTQEAEHAFGNVVSLGIANKTLGVKLLFNPNTTDFWSDPKVSGHYPIWLRQIARQTAQAKVCMSIIGHTSHTGTEPHSDKLSAQR